MIARNFKEVFFTVIGFCILITIIGFTSFDFIEFDTAASWTMRYFALPILIVTAPACYYVYLNFIRQHEKKQLRSAVWIRLRTIFRIFILTIAMSMIFIVTTLSTILLTNAYLGSSKTISLNAEIVESYSKKSKGRIRHYIKIKDPQIERSINLKVNSPYQTGQTFTKTMQIGYWGLLYSRK